MTFLKTTLIAALGLGMTAAANAGEPDTQIAEDQLMDACINSKNNSPEGCLCVMNGFKRELEPENYTLFLEMFAVAMSGDASEMMDFVLSGRMPLEKLQAMGKDMEDVSKKLEDECDDVDFAYKAEKT